jgi:hypothetical protein
MCECEVLLTHEFMQDCASRISSRVQITTDGHRAYLEAVEGAFGMDVDYAQLQKIYGASNEPEKRYSPGTWRMGAVGLMK